MTDEQKVQYQFEISKNGDPKILIDSNTGDEKPKIVYKKNDLSGQN